MALEKYGTFRGDDHVGPAELNHAQEQLFERTVIADRGHRRDRSGHVAFVEAAAFGHAPSPQQSMGKALHSGIDVKLHVRNDGLMGRIVLFFDEFQDQQAHVSVGRRRQWQQMG